jgi:carboxymethylenebutenolidase
MSHERQSIELTGRDGGTVPTLIYPPDGPGPHPAVVIGVEAFGINAFTDQVGYRLSELGYLVVVPDYYRGDGLADPESYLDFAEVRDRIDVLDFRQATHDLLAAVDHAATRADVDPSRIVTWGYCTGASLAWLAAALSDRVAAAVLFFPSQPWFAQLTPLTPSHPVDLLWAVRCPMLFLYGDQDGIMPPDRLEKLRAQLHADDVPHQINIYEGAGHAFAAPVPPLRNDAADRASWTDALEFLADALPH